MMVGGLWRGFGLAVTITVVTSSLPNWPALADRDDDVRIAIDFMSKILEQTIEEKKAAARVGILNIVEGKIAKMEPFALPNLKEGDGFLIDVPLYENSGQTIEKPFLAPAPIYGGYGTSPESAALQAATSNLSFLENSFGDYIIKSFGIPPFDSTPSTAILSEESFSLWFFKSGQHLAHKVIEDAEKLWSDARRQRTHLQLLKLQTETGASSVRYATVAKSYQELIEAHRAMLVKQEKLDIVSSLQVQLSRAAKLEAQAYAALKEAQKEAAFQRAIQSVAAMFQFADVASQSSNRQETLQGKAGYYESTINHYRTEGHQLSIEIQTIMISIGVDSSVVPDPKRPKIISP